VESRLALFAAWVAAKGATEPGGGLLARRRPVVTPLLPRKGADGVTDGDRVAVSAAETETTGDGAGDASAVILTVSVAVRTAEIEATAVGSGDREKEAVGDCDGQGTPGQYAVSIAQTVCAETTALVGLFPTKVA
jgi:hypothetical protein